MGAVTAKVRYAPSPRERARLHRHLDEAAALEPQRMRDAAELVRRAAMAVSSFSSDLPTVLHRPERREQGWSLSFIGAGGTHEGLVESFRDVLTVEHDVLPYDPLRPKEEERNHVISLLPDERVLSPVYWEFFRKSDIAHRVHTRTLVCDGPRLLAWFGTMHSPSRTSTQATAHAEWVIATAVKRLRPLLRWIVGVSPSDARALGAALFDAIPGEAYLLDRDGRIEAANTLGSVHLRSRGYHLIVGELRALARRRRGRRYEAGASLSAPAVFDVHPLEGAARTGTFIAVRRPVRDIRDVPCASVELEARVAAAALCWRLSPTETRILRLLGRGAANKEVAEDVAISVRTTEAHVNSILRKSHADSRLQVVARLWLGAGGTGGGNG